ncbi:hypothetical protein D6D06_09429 [Aureobasidium pullulans]|nr:hypothetical protein D6D06_09429 [Aureobasidium pullulans]
MSFDQLPSAILLLVASHLQSIDGSLAEYFTVNRSWNSVIEALTFRELRSDDRRAALHGIDIIIQLPEYGKDRWYEFESEHEEDTNNIVFSDSLREVFDILNSWQEYKGDHAQLTLAIQAISKSDSWHLGNIDRIRRRGRAASAAADVRLEARELPPLLTVSNLSFRGALHVRQLPGNPSRPCCPRLLSGKTITRVTKACTRVRDVAAELSDKESKNLVLRNAERLAFAKNLIYLPKSVTRLKLSYPGVVPANQFFNPPAIPFVDGKDALSTSLSRISRRLECLEVHAVLSEDISDMNESLSWPRLRRLHIEVDSCTPHGEWLLELDPEDSESEMPARIHYPEISFRTAVNRDILDDLCLTAARAVARMPNLRDLQLTVGDEDFGCVCRLSSDGRCTHRLVWISKSQTMYEPHPDVMKAWKAGFADRLGELDVQILGHEHYPIPPV